jgi:CheY-like chemotaxis protein
VSDTGGGMREEIQARIFEPFFTTKEVNKGTGLGLSMAYGIIKQHEGHINVYSEIGNGTTFKVFLPAVDVVVEEEKKGLKPVVLSGIETILVAEDEEALRHLSKDILETLGYEVLMAKNGKEAIEMYIENRDRIKVLVFDIVMPLTGGAEAYEQIRAAGGNVPVVFMTGYGSEVMYDRIAEQGKEIDHSMMKIIQKPYSLDGLGRAVRDVLDSTN